MIQDEFVFVSPQIMIRFAHLLWHRGSTVHASRCCLPKSAHNVYNCSNTCIFYIMIFHILQRKIHANCNFAHFHFHEKFTFASKVRTNPPSHFCGSTSFRLLEASTEAADAIDKNITIDAPPCCSPPWEKMMDIVENTLPELTGFAAWK